MDAKMLTPEQVASYLEISRDAVYRLIRRRQLEAARVGRCYMVTAKDLDAFLLAHGKGDKYRSAQFRRVFDIGKRNPDLDGDEFLEWLEEQDELRKQRSE